MDHKSLTGGLLTGLGFISGEATKSNIIFLLTVLVALTTIIYNVVKVYEWVKRK